MARPPAPPPFTALKRQIAGHRAARTARGESLFVRETFRMERSAARQKAQEWFRDWPKAAYWTEVESWRPLDGDRIEFTMRRLPTAD